LPWEGPLYSGLADFEWAELQSSFVYLLPA
jgi:hypothetical protein